MKHLVLALAALSLAACGPTPYAPQAGYQPPGSTGGLCAGIGGFACEDPNDTCVMNAGQCRMADAAGTCTPRPDVCIEIYQPVCGCDGKTYGNSCEAQREGVAVLHNGACT